MTLHYTVGTGVAAMAVLIATIYLADRGLANTAESIGIWFLRASRYLRRRRAAVELAQHSRLQGVLTDAAA